MHKSRNVSASSIPDAPGGTWIGPRHFDALTNVPNYKDLSPRLGVAYDLFGNGKTAVKATLSRYVLTSSVGTARLLNPLNTSVNSATRSWQDTNHDGIPQLSELGPLSVFINASQRNVVPSALILSPSQANRAKR